jgi:hypothetical protein
MRAYIRGVLTVGLAAALPACLDLDVVNENEPDNDLTLQTPANVETIMGISTFRQWYNVLHGLANVTIPFGVISDENTNTAVQLNVQWSQEPRVAFNNDELAAQVWLPRHPYDNFSECIANINDTMERINDGLRITTQDPGASGRTDNTDRAVAWGKLWQGACIGYLANTLDRFPLATEDTVLPKDDVAALAAWERERLAQPDQWKEALKVAINSIEFAIQKAETGSQWVTPDAWVPGRQYNNAQMIQLAHTMIARLLVYSARYPEDRAALDWNRVLFHTERGLQTFDFGPVLASGVITDESYLLRLLSTTSTSRFRADYRLIGPADQSGNYQTWLNTNPHSTAQRFVITTPDRRITGATTAGVSTGTLDGAYYRYFSDTGGMDVNRGLQHFSNYAWWRRNNPVNGSLTQLVGHYPLVTADENRLYRAEAMLRLNRLDEAAALINVTRTRNQRYKTATGTAATVYATSVGNLPPVTAAGVPEVNGQCVPRKASGECGDLWDALMYERAIELHGIDPTRAWMDRRGFGQLQPGTWVQLPVSARYLTTLGVQRYTFGGVGGPGAAR